MTKVTLEMNSLTRRDLLKSVPVVAAGAALTGSSPLWLPPAAASAETVGEWWTVSHKSEWVEAPKELFGENHYYQEFMLTRKSSAPVYKPPLQGVSVAEEKTIELACYLDYGSLTQTTTDTTEIYDTIASLPVVIHGLNDVRYELSTGELYHKHYDNSRRLNEDTRPDLPDTGLPGAPANAFPASTTVVTTNYQYRLYSTNSFTTYVVADYYDSRDYLWHRRVSRMHGGLFGTHLIAFYNTIEEAYAEFTSSADLTSTAAELAIALTGGALQKNSASANQMRLVCTAISTVVGLANVAKWIVLRNGLNMLEILFYADENHYPSDQQNGDFPGW